MNEKFPITQSVLEEMLVDMKAYLESLPLEYGEDEDDDGYPIPVVPWSYKIRHEGVYEPLARLLPAEIVEVIENHNMQDCPVTELLNPTETAVVGSLMPADTSLGSPHVYSRKQLNEELRAAGLIHRGVRYAWPSPHDSFREWYVMLRFEDNALIYFDDPDAFADEMAHCIRLTQSGQPRSGVVEAVGPSIHIDWANAVSAGTVYRRL